MNIVLILLALLGVAVGGFLGLSWAARHWIELSLVGDADRETGVGKQRVSLMTMHAAKGLEFPIVFLVNLQMPGRGRGGGVMHQTACALTRC